MKFDLHNNDPEAQGPLSEPGFLGLKDCHDLAHGER